MTRTRPTFEQRVSEDKRTPAREEDSSWKCSHHGSAEVPGSIRLMILAEVLRWSPSTAGRYGMSWALQDSVDTA